MNVADATSTVVGMVPLVMSIGILDKTMKTTFPKSSTSKSRRRRK